MTEPDLEGLAEAVADMLVAGLCMLLAADALRAFVEMVEGP